MISTANRTSCKIEVIQFEDLFLSVFIPLVYLLLVSPFCLCDFQLTLLVCFLDTKRSQWHLQSSILVVQVVVLSLPLFLEILFVLPVPTCGRTKTFALSMSIFKILGILGLLTSHSTLDHFFDGFDNVNISDWSRFLFNHQGSPLLVGGDSEMAREIFVQIEKSC